MKRLRKLNKIAEHGILAAVILLVAVMFGTIISATIFFAFADATEPSQSTTETYIHTATVADANNTAHYFKLHAIPDGTTPSWNITLHATGSGTYYAKSSSNYTYIAANNTLKFNAGFYNYGKTKHNTSATVTFHVGTYGAVNAVVGYAVTTFGLIAIVPLIIVGGIMLRSLGFMSSGKENI